LLLGVASPAEHGEAQQAELNQPSVKAWLSVHKSPRLRGSFKPKLAATAINDETVRQIVGGDCDADAIAGENSNVVPTHATRELRADDRPTLIYLDCVLSPTQSVFNDALHFQKIAFTHR